MTPPTAGAAGEQLLKYFQASGMTRMAVAYDTKSAFATTGWTKQKQLAAKYGITFVAEETFETGTEAGGYGQPAGPSTGVDQPDAAHARGRVPVHTAGPRRSGRRRRGDHRGARRRVRPHRPVAAATGHHAEVVRRAQCRADARGGRVSRSFGGVIAVRDVSLSVAHGELRGIIGPNGAGKSTLFNLVSGHLQADHGTVSYRGAHLERRSAHRRARDGIAIVFQGARIFRGMTVLENVMMGAHAHSRYGFIAGALRLPAQRREEQEICRVPQPQPGMSPYASTTFSYAVYAVPLVVVLLFLRRGLLPTGADWVRRALANTASHKPKDSDTSSATARPRAPDGGSPEQGDRPRVPAARRRPDGRHPEQRAGRSRELPPSWRTASGQRLHEIAIPGCGWRSWETTLAYRATCTAETAP